MLSISHVTGGVCPLKRNSQQIPNNKHRIKSQKLSIRHNKCASAADASIGGGNGAGGKGGSGGGGGDGSEPNDDSDEGFKFKWQGWSDRVAADPDFRFKVFTEQILGVGAAVLGDMLTRPNFGLNELDFVFATLVVGSIMNFSLMYFLAPVASSKGTQYASMSLLEKFFAEETLTRMGAPGGHIFQPGYSLQGKAINLLYKMVMFGGIGMSAGILGTTLSNQLLALRVKMDPTYVSPNAPPKVLDNASVWAVHMGVSSNVRYQILNGADMMFSAALPPSVFKLLTFTYRTGNNILGGVSFVTLAKLMGVQKTAEEKAAAQTKPTEPSKTKKK